MCNDMQPLLLLNDTPFYLVWIATRKGDVGSLFWPEPPTKIIRIRRGFTNKNEHVLYLYAI